MKINQSDIRPDVPAPGGGTPGPPGPDGADSTVPGPPGADGTNGTNGTNGLDGVTPAFGVDYFNGADGANGTDGADSTVPGPAGADGADGAPGPACPLTDLTDVTITAGEQGDLIYLNSAGEWVNKHHGNAGEVLASGGHGADPAWAASSAPGAHKTTHEDGGTDEISVAGLSGHLADAQDPTAHNLIDTTGHPASGLTAGHFLKATAGTTYAFGAHGLTAADVGAAAAAHATTHSPGGTDALTELATGWISTADAWSYASAITITVPAGAAAKYSPGMRIRLTQTTVKYFIVTAVANTVLTVYGGTDYTVANAAISAISYSTVKAPLGFPLDPAKWTVRATSTSSVTQVTVVANTWYNLGGSLSIPIGVWNVIYQICAQASMGANSTATVDIYAALSTAISPATGNPSDLDLAAWAQYTYVTAAAWGQVASTINRQKFLSIASPTTYYSYLKADQTTGTLLACGDKSTTIIQATCAYL